MIEEEDNLQDSAPERRSRTAEKRERVAGEESLAQLVRDLVQLKEADRRALDLPEIVLDGLADAKKMKNPSALARHLRHVRSMLRGLEWEPLLRRLDLLRAGYAPERVERTTCVRWTERLLVQGDEGLRSFLQLCPEADRRRLRQLVQNVKRAADGKRLKARAQLDLAVKSSLLEAGISPDSSEEDEEPGDSA